MVPSVSQIFGDRWWEGCGRWNAFVDKNPTSLQSDWRFHWDIQMQISGERILPSFPHSSYALGAKSPSRKGRMTAVIDRGGMNERLYQGLPSQGFPTFGPLKGGLRLPSTA